ncbi:hypothetical protein HDE_01422 [Halotydeus destructor]|nr:hypothetical protein HDE_01422 [Halotydeus destructor]
MNPESKMADNPPGYYVLFPEAKGLGNVGEPEPVDVQPSPRPVGLLEIPKYPPCYRCVQLILCILIITYASLNLITASMIHSIVSLPIKVHLDENNYSGNGTSFEEFDQIPVGVPHNMDVLRRLSVLILVTALMMVIVLGFGLAGVVRGDKKMVIRFAVIMTIWTVFTLGKPVVGFTSSIMALSWWFYGLIKQKETFQDTLQVQFVA